MIGQYVRMVISPHKMGTIKAARFEEDHTSFLFQQDSRFKDHFPDVWLVDADLEEFPRSTDEEVELMNRQGHRGHYTFAGS